MKMLNFHYIHSHQTCFHYCYITFVFVMGNRFLHIYLESVIYFVSKDIPSIEVFILTRL